MTSLLAQGLSDFPLIPEEHKLDSRSAQERQEHAIRSSNTLAADGKRAGGESVEPFKHALEVIAAVMRDGVATHPDNEWIRHSVDYHLVRAEEHLRLLHEGDQQQDHLSHAATRLLMALTLRELG